jgi:hypothetical protein
MNGSQPMSEALKLRALTRAQSARRFAELKDTDFHPQSDLPDQVMALRNSVITAYQSASRRTQIDQDRSMGLALYGELLPDKLTMRAAADDRIWRYLSLDVFPDLVLQRSGPDADAWFWSSRWRIWLKRTWWLIHLSWQDDPATTGEVLKNWTTDSVAQFVERPGRGFRVALWRCIARENARRKFNQHQFRRVMKMNTALLATFDPTVSPELIEPYVVNLFDNINLGK